MSWTIIIAIILIGLFLAIVELYLIPGTTVVGLIGAVIVVIGIYLAFSNYGVKAGTITLIVSAVVTVVMFVGAFKMFASGKFAVQNEIDGKVDMLKDVKIATGDVGIALGAIKPYGKAFINGNRLEVQSKGDFIDEGNKLKVVSISQNKVIVKPIIENSDILETT